MKKMKYLLLCSLMMLLAACEKDTEATNFAPGVTTGNSTDIYRKGAVLSGSVRRTGTTIISKYGILFSELESMAEYVEHPVTDRTSDFSVRLSDLNPGTTYYYCAYAYSGYSFAKGEVRSFKTTDSNAPIFASITSPVTDITTCQVSASLLDEGGSEIELSGFCWKKAEEGEPTTNDHIQNVVVTNGSMAVELTGLEPDTEYIVRAYATNHTGTGYSESIRVKTKPTLAPTLSAITQKEATDFSVTIEARITDVGTSAVTEAGFCWSADSQVPDITGSHVDLSEQLEGDNMAMVTTLKDLKPGTTYYIRAYAINGEGTTYSEVTTFTTAEAKTPVVSAITQKSSADFSVTLEVEVTDGGNSAVTKAGFCWSTDNKEPTVSDSTKELASQLTDGNKVLNATLSDLKPGTTYYIRAYATNEFGTVYSETVTFTTGYSDAENGNTGIDDLPTTEWK